MKGISSPSVVKICIVFCAMLICSHVKGGNLLNQPLREKGIRFLLEAGLGNNHYSSPGGLYKMDQSVYYATGVLGYDIKSLFLGLGGTAARHTKEHLYSFRAFLNTRYRLKNVPLNPYAELLGGVVGYLKWNDFVKPYYGLGAGVHLLPRVCTGLRVSNVGTLDNNGSWEYSLYVSFVIGK